MDLASSGSLDFLSAEGEMAELIRATDWSKSPLGPPETWPQSLKTTVSLCLASNFPINIIWGPEHTQIYNDGYRVVCGDAHPTALGEAYTKTWASAWPAIGEPFERARAGNTSFLENQRMFLFRNGYLEETFFTFSLSPIRDESGGIGGVFHPVNETTTSMLAARRTRIVRDLGARLADARASSDVCAFALDTLGRHDLDLPFVLIYALDAEAGEYRLTGCAGTEQGGGPAPLTLALDAVLPWPVGALIQARAPVYLDKISALIGDTPCGPYEEPPHTAFAAPIIIPGSDLPVALLIAGVSPRLPLDDAYRSFGSLLCSTLAAALANARFYEQQQQRAEALAALDHAKTTFFSNVSHEFRTPLTLLLGPIEDVLAEADTLPLAQRALLDVAHRNAERLLKLVNSLLDFSRIEAGRMQVSLEQTDLAAYTADLASNFRSACERAGLSLTVDCPPLPRPVHVDRAMWEKVVLNLISNAFKFTLTGGITVRLQAAGDTVELSVRDTGVGIAEAELTRVFERFHRIEGQKGRTYEGTGIGLSLVEELVKLHGGTVQVKSRLGEGSAFKVSLPFRADPSSLASFDAPAPAPEPTAVRASAYVAEALRWLPDDEVAAAASAEKAAGAPLIVLADDNADMRGYVKSLLEQAGYEVAAFEHGRAALEAIRRGPAPDLVLSDVMMPELDGFGLLAAIRADPALTGMLVILLSARAGEEARVEGLAAGADDYLVKPFSARELRARVDGAVTLARQRHSASASEKALETEIATAHSRAALRQTEQQLEFALRASRLGSWELDLRTGRFACNDYCRTNFGVGPTDRFEHQDDVSARVHPDDREPRQRALQQAVATAEDFDIEYRVERPEGQVGWLLTRGRAVYSEAGEAIGMAGISMDITLRKAAEDRQRLLLDELNHRVKNTLATVQSIALQTRRYVSAPASFDETFHARLRALALAHELLTDTSWEGASLQDVISRTLAPHHDEEAARRITLGGPRVRLGPNAAVTLNMAFHELATNAAKYGALSDHQGGVEVEWRIADDRGAKVLEIDWREGGGPVVAVPTRRGFGSRLIEQGLVHELSGEAQLVFKPEGLWCRMRFPLSAKLSLAA